MHARVLRRWSHVRYLMLLWLLSVTILLLIYCRTATSTPLLINTKLKPSSAASSSTMVSSNIILDDNSVIYDHHDHHYDRNERIVKDFKYNNDNNNINNNNNNNNSKKTNNTNNNYYYDKLKQHKKHYSTKSDITSNSANSNNLYFTANIINIPKINSQINNLNILNNNNNKPSYKSANNHREEDYITLNYNTNLGMNRNYNNNNMRNSRKKYNFMTKQLDKPCNKFTLTYRNYKNNTEEMILLNNKKCSLVLQNWDLTKTLLIQLLSSQLQNLKKRIGKKINSEQRRNYYNKQIRDSNKRNSITTKLLESDQSSGIQRKKHDRTDIYHQQLIMLKQLPISSDSDNDNSHIPLKKFYDIITTVTTNRADINLGRFMIGRNRRDSYSFPTQQVASSLSLLNQRYLQHQEQDHRRSKRYCSARDPTQLAYEAPTVFEGKIKSMSYDRSTNFSATFEVKKIYKCQTDYKLPDLLRLQFTHSNTNGECDIYREHLRSRGIVHQELNQGNVYIVFVKQVAKGNFTILGQPIKRTRRNMNAVKIGVNEKYAQPASVKSLTANKMTNKIIIRNGDTLRLLCKVAGQPPPKVTWFKDGKSVRKNRSKLNSSINPIYQFVQLKKRSELIIRRFSEIYAGVYECRAKNKVNKKPAKETIRVEQFQTNLPHSIETSFGGDCPGDMQSYCLNGATCRYFREIHEKSCVCPEGYNGERCQEKTTTLNTSTYQKENQQCESYKGGFYC